ncbi:interleukin-21 receptor-like isoform X2 [Echeneis naucrates]|nr:interleukin-21 receptor-like isoform X2 [Echeneis naucrates]
MESNFMDLDKFSIHLCDGFACHSLAKIFKPAKNIRLTPPSDVEVQEGAEGFNITWKSEYDNHDYLKRQLDYELLLQKSQSSWSQTLKLSATFGSIPRSDLVAHGAYCIKVRSRPAEYRKAYNGTWSEWSPMTCWQVKTQEEQDSLSLILTKSLTPVGLLLVGLLLIVLFSPASRMKIKTLSHTPSPAHFFQPLFQQHESNLQEWFTPQGKFALIYKTEEPPMTCDIMVVPKPIPKDPEENQDVFSLSVTPLTFSQSPSSYVGLPELHEAPPPVTMSFCPGNTSYTQLPCSVWDFAIKEAQVTPGPPETLSEISRADSGCSCEDLTEDPECSLPNSPVDESSPPCFRNDYCILNKTADGVVPVLVSK